MQTILQPIATMKGLLIGSVMVNTIATGAIATGAIGISAIALQSPVLAETIAIQMDSMAIPPMEATPAPEMEQRHEALTPQPVMVRRPGEAAQPIPPLDPSHLQQITRSIQPRSAHDSGSGIPANLIPTDLIHTPRPYSSDTDPLSFFKAPGPNPSYGINLNGIQ